MKKLIVVVALSLLLVGCAKPPDSIKTLPIAVQYSHELPKEFIFLVIDGQHEYISDIQLNFWTTAETRLERGHYYEWSNSPSYDHPIWVLRTDKTIIFLSGTILEIKRNKWGWTER